MTEIQLTIHETAVLKNLHRFEYMDQGISTEQLWASSFADDVQAVCGVEPASVGGIVASLCKKGFFALVPDVSDDDNGINIHDLAREYNRRLNSEA